MNRQISYNGPLATSSFPVRMSPFGTVPFPRTFPPCNFPSSLPSGPMNHPLPPKPLISKYFFHAYTPLDLRTPSESTTSPRIDHGGCVPVTSEPESLSSDHQIRVLGGTKAENIISFPSDGTYESFSFIIKGRLSTVIFPDTIQGLESGCEVTSIFSFDDADPPRPETFLRAQNHDPFGRKSSFSPRCADGGLCHADANPVSEVPEPPPSTIKSSGGGSVSDKDDDGLSSRCMLYEGEEGLLDVPRSEVQPSFEHVAETSPPQLDHQVAQGITSRSLYIKVDSVRSNPTNRNRPAGAALETDGKAGGPRTRARARAEASEASSSLSTSRSARPYSAAEDEVLQNLVARGLAWKQIERESGQLFAKRTLRSLQLHWSRNLKPTALPTRSSKRKRSALS
jgi:hypothetical protein